MRRARRATSPEENRRKPENVQNATMRTGEERKRRQRRPIGRMSAKRKRRMRGGSQDRRKPKTRPTGPPRQGLQPSRRRTMSLASHHMVLGAARRFLVFVFTLRNLAS